MARGRVVVVGAGQAGMNAAFAARTAGWAGGVVLVGDESAPPYSRPALSKSYLTTAGGPTSLPLRLPAAYADAGVDLVTGVDVVAVDRAAGCVRLGDGTALGYDRLVLATGARPRVLAGRPGPETGVLTVRSLADAAILRRRLANAPRVLVIGGGVLGLEIASSAATAGARVNVLEAGDRLMARVVSTPVSTHLRELHEAHGVRILLGTGVQGIRRDGAGYEVRTDRGSQAADLVVVAVGITPDTGLADGSGLRTDDGVLVDRALVTSDPLVAAAGDCARQVRRPGARGTRLESEQSAIEQGAHAGRWLASGEPVPFAGMNVSWTEQHGSRIYLAGAPGPGDTPVVRGDPTGTTFAVYHLRDGAVTGVEAVNSVADYRTTRRLLSAPESNRFLSPEGIADGSMPVDPRAALTPSR